MTIRTMFQAVLLIVLVLAGLPLGNAQARFLSTDPIGYQDQLNLYAYVHNDPVNLTDPNGEDSCRECRMAAYQSRGPVNPQHEAIAKAAIGFLPVVGSVQGIVEAAVNPSVGTIGTAAIGLVPGVGGALKGALKHADEAFDALSDGMKMGTDDALDAAADVLGDGYRQIDDGVFRSADGQFQVRMTDSDLAKTNNHFGGPHINVEKGATVTKPNGNESFKVQENKHIFLPEEELK